MFLQSSGMDLFIVSIMVVFMLDTGGGTETRVCWFASKESGRLSVQRIDDDLDGRGYGTARIQGSNQTCPKVTNACYALWEEDTSGNSSGGILIIAQGCWETSSELECDSSDCVTSTEPSKALKNTNFCCCRGDFCNGNVTQMYNEESKVTPTQVIGDVEEPYVQALKVCVILLLLILIFVVVLLIRCLHRKQQENSKPCQDSVHLMEGGNMHSSHFTLDNLKLERLIGQGRYGSVWQGTVGDQPVAVKIFPPHHRNYFYNELDIYCLPFMSHPSLLSYFGYDERTSLDGSIEYLLFLSLAPKGSLQDYLRANVVEWSVFCRMALSVARGVAHLHTDIRKGDKFKPCISHRDLSTKNILVKDDLSCAICDLGLATKMSGSKYYCNGEEHHADIGTGPVLQVGTLRYMSPEVLEGAVNLRDCETSLKQMDVYALGLVLWELATRCGDLYPPGVDCGSYRLPFEAEMGHPSLEQMQVLVCKHKARPLFPDHWRDSPPVRTIRETIEDCWDQDAEARLTALCVEERLHELAGLPDRQKVSLYPSAVSPSARPILIQKDSHNVLGSDKEGDSCVSESTMDTLLAISPANPLVNYKNSNQLVGLCPSVQPYQGRNPCLERNLMQPRECESGSRELIDKSAKHIAPIAVESSAIVSEYLSLYSSNAQQNPGGGYSNHSEPILRANVPIPFLQNVSADSGVPKQINIPRPHQGRRITWRNLKKVFEGKRRHGDVSPQIDCSAKSNLISNETSTNLSTPITPTDNKLDTHVALSNNGKAQTKLVAPASDLVLGTQNNRRPNTLPLVKPGDLSGSPGPNNAKTRNNVRNVEKILRNIEKSRQNPETSRKRYSLGVKSDRREERNSKAKSLSEVEELKILRLESKMEQAFNKNLKILETVSQKPLVQPKKDKTPRNSPKNKETEKTSLIKDNQPEKSNSGRKSLEEVFTREVELKDPNLRIKTPGDVPLALRKIRSEKYTARFSLYDDRIMSGYYDNDTLYTCTNNKNQNQYHQIFTSFEDIQFSQNI